MEDGSKEEKAIRLKEEGKENIGCKDGVERMTGDRAPTHILYEDQLETLSVSNTHTNISSCFSVREGDSLWEKGRRGNAGYPLPEEKILDTNQ